MKSKRSKVTWLAVVGALGSSFMLAIAVQSFAGDKQSESFHQTYSLSSNGHLSLDNVNGDVHITGWDRDQVQVDAVKTVWSGTSLSDVAIQVDSRPDSVRIETKYHHYWFGDSHWRVDYTLMVPKRASLDKIGLVNGTVNVESAAGEVNASSVNGRIKVRNLSGPADLSGVNGTISAVYDDSDISQPISLKTVNGAISLSLPANPNIALSARTLNGGISCDFPIAINAGYVGHSLDGKLGRGGAAVHLNTVNGSISIRRESGEAN